MRDPVKRWTKIIDAGIAIWISKSLNSHISNYSDSMRWNLKMAI